MSDEPNDKKGKPMSLFSEQVSKDQHSFHNRQHALESLKQTCSQERVCPACATSAGLYLAAQAALCIDYDKDAFLKLAEQIFDDLTRQLKGQLQ